MRATDELIGRIVNASQVPSGKRRREIARELRSHMEDFVSAARQAGREESEIEKLVVANFGDPAQVARSFAWVYRNDWRALRALVYTLTTVLLASGLLAVILTVQAGLAFSFGRPMMRMLASRHTVSEGLDILTSVAAYLGVTLLESIFEDRRFQKAAFLITVILTILMTLCFATGLRPAFLLFGVMNGIFFRAVRLFLNSMAARVATVAVCFPLAGLALTLLQAPDSPPLLAICASWLSMGAGYLLMTNLATRLDSALLNGFSGIKRT